MLSKTELDVNEKISKHKQLKEILEESTMENIKGIAVFDYKLLSKELVFNFNINY